MTNELTPPTEPEPLYSPPEFKQIQCPNTNCMGLHQQLLTINYEEGVLQLLCYDCNLLWFLPLGESFTAEEPITTKPAPGYTR